MASTTHYSFTILTAFLLTLGMNNIAWGKKLQPLNDGKYYFEVMEASIIEVIEEHQNIINVNADGSVKDRSLTSKQIYRRAYDNFKTITGLKKFSLELLHFNI